MASRQVPPTDSTGASAAKSGAAYDTMVSKMLLLLADSTVETADKEGVGGDRRYGENYNYYSVKFELMYIFREAAVSAGL